MSCTESDCRVRNNSVEARGIPSRPFMIGIASARMRVYSCSRQQRRTAARAEGGLRTWPLPRWTSPTGCSSCEPSCNTPVLPLAFVVRSLGVSAAVLCDRALRWPQCRALLPRLFLTPSCCIITISSPFAHFIPKGDTTSPLGRISGHCMAGL